ncbi:MAG: hypothetical protein IJ006_07865, partial [Lachnospiraceae bacterium]|nr:hypothetical protein [Lachnospiraceae bacterium]
MRACKVSIEEIFGSLLPEISDYANAPTTERLCREVGAEHEVQACTQYFPVLQKNTCFFLSLIL